MAEKAMTGAALGEKLLPSVGQMKASKRASWVRDYGTKVLSERDAGVINPNEAKMNAIVEDLRS